MARLTEDTFEDATAEMEQQAIEAETKRRAGFKTRGKARNPHYLSYPDAVEAVRAEQISSVTEYKSWHAKHKPNSLPSRPDRVYVKPGEFTTWNAFLGTNTKFGKGLAAPKRPYLEAVKWATTLKLESQTQWLEWCAIPGNVPADIPKRPDVAYKDFRGWRHWLGSRPSDIAEARKEIIRKTQVFYVIREEGAPQNVYTFGVEHDGETNLKIRWESEKFHIVKFYWNDPDKEGLVQSVINEMSSPYLGNDKQRIVPNIWEVLWQCDRHLDQIIKF